MMKKLELFIFDHFAEMICIMSVFWIVLVAYGLMN
ncbi:hypothetical protein LCGC14_1272920 [marine sediment metagenome]|uniref:Uncharacterized protein n=1 Tax=marine sediment metagenome TaxID=412755 RepID=A0A0F9KZE6_9ZZZZ